MKKAILFILPMIVFLSSCIKENDELNRAAIYGKWRLTFSCGGVVGCLPAPEDDIATLEVTEKEIIYQTINSQTKASTHYRRINYSILNSEVLDSKVTYNLRLEDGTEYGIEVLKGRMVLQNGNYQSYYTKL